MGSELNRSKDFFPKLDALQFSELKVLRDKMNARSEPDIDILLGSIGAPVTKDTFEIDDGIPIVQNRKAVLYLREPANVQKYGLPKYHILHCRTLQTMQEMGQYHKYQASDRTDGQFSLRLSPTSELSLRELIICRYCLNQLKSRFGWDVFPTQPEDFPLADWLESFFDYSSEDWQERSESCREKANWICQEQGCNINLESNPHLLHAHHKWGTKFDNPQDLVALCIGCHARQPGGGHRMLKYYPDYEEFMKKYGDEWINSSPEGNVIEIGF